jgi:hypothetical protein
MSYKLYITSSGEEAVMTVGVSPSRSFLKDETNPDYQAYLAWVAEGNTPLPPDAVEETQ